MNKVIFLVVILASLTSNANDWTGNGSLLSFDGKYHTCEKIDLAIEQTATTLVIKKLDYFCDTWELHWQSVETEIRANEVYYQDTRIGDITSGPNGDVISLTFLDFENNLGEKVEFRISNGVLSLYDELFALDTLHTYTKAEGELGPR